MIIRLLKCLHYLVIGVDYSATFYVVYIAVRKSR